MSSITHFKVVIIGAGPAGIGAATALSKRGVKSIALVERSDKIGGIPALYKTKKGGVRTFVRWSRGGIPVFGEEYARWLSLQLARTETKVWLQSQVIEIEAKEILRGQGLMVASIGDYIIKEVFDKSRGVYPCKPDIFKQTYIDIHAGRHRL